MGRPARETPGGMVYHVLNRSVGRRTLFKKTADYHALLQIIDETLRSRPMRICSYCLMPNHWHFVLWPERDDDLSAFMQQMTNTHVKRWKQHYHETGYGHLYQGRFKSFPVQTDDYFYQVIRYAERNALRGHLVQQAEDWRWSSLSGRLRDGDLSEFPLISRSIHGDWPLPRPKDWLRIVNTPQTEAELAAVRRCVNRGCPFGDPEWVTATAEKLGLGSTIRRRGHPKKN